MVAVLTGAADGIGKHCAVLLFKKGYTVYDLSHRDPGAKYLRHIDVDVACRNAVEKAIDSIVETEGRIDLAILSAGISLASPAELTHLRDAKRLFDVNYWGSVYTANHILRQMKRQRSGRILFLSSLTAVTPVPYLAYYSSSKAAVASYAAALANEAAPFGIGVAAVMPGGVKTQFSYKRKKYKQFEQDSQAPGLAKAIRRITAVEQHGASPKRTAAEIVALAHRSPMPFVKAVGGLYGLAGPGLRLVPTPLLQTLLRKFFSV